MGKSRPARARGSLLPAATHTRTCLNARRNGGSRQIECSATHSSERVHHLPPCSMPTASNRPW